MTNESIATALVGNTSGTSTEARRTARGGWESVPFTQLVSWCARRRAMTWCIFTDATLWLWLWCEPIATTSFFGVPTLRRFSLSKRPFPLVQFVRHTPAPAVKPVGHTSAVSETCRGGQLRRGSCRARQRAHRNHSSKRATHVWLARPNLIFPRSTPTKLGLKEKCQSCRANSVGIWEMKARF